MYTLCNVKGLENVILMYNNEFFDSWLVSTNFVGTIFLGYYILLEWGLYLSKIQLKSLIQYTIRDGTQFRTLWSDSPGP